MKLKTTNKANGLATLILVVSISRTLERFEIIDQEGLIGAAFVSKLMSYWSHTVL